VTATLAPVRITERHRSLRGQLQAWAAVTVDGEWLIARLEVAGTPWELTHLPTGTGCGWFGSLLKARRAISDGSALAAVKQARLAALREECAAAGITAESPAELDDEAEHLYALERDDCED